MKLISEERRRAYLARLAFRLNEVGLALISRSRRLVGFMNGFSTDSESERFLLGLPALHARIQDLLTRQARDYPHHKYFHGYPYQSLAILGIFGERPTEERFDTYGLAELVGKDDLILDVGCNCGFMGLITAYRTGCRVVGVDINPYMIEFGRSCAAYLRLGDRVHLEATRFQDFVPDRKFSVVFSFATHWTDDGKYRVALPDHLTRIHGLLRENGLLVFESHCADVGNPAFYDAVESMRPLFTWDPALRIENGTRELFLMRRR